MARPTDLDAAQAERVASLVRAGNFRETAAIGAGIPVATFYRWMARGSDDAPCVKREADGAALWRGCAASDHSAGECPGNAAYREFREAVEQAEAQAEMIALSDLQKQMKSGGSPAAAIAFLERRFRARWSPRQEVAVEHRGNIGVPFEIRIIPHDRPQEELDELTRELSSPLGRELSMGIVPTTARVEPSTDSGAKD